MSGSQIHQRACKRCKAKQWCGEVMDLIARNDGFLSWDMKLAVILGEQKANKEALCSKQS